MRFGVLVLLSVSGCGSMLSGLNEYCEERADCIDANEEDEKACVVDIRNSQRIARVYGCEDDYVDYIECMKDEADCESQGRYEYWTDRGECEDDLDDWLDCLADESDVIGGSSSDWDDTGSWDAFEVSPSEEEEDSWSASSDSCTFANVVCYHTNEADNEAWCSNVGGAYSYSSCPSGYYGTCDVPAGGDFTAPATGFFYDGSEYDGSELCANIGGTYTPNY